MANFIRENFFTLILLVGVGMIVAFAAVAYLLLKLGQKFGGEKAVKAIGVVLVGLVLFWDVRYHPYLQQPAGLHAVSMR